MTPPPELIHSVNSLQGQIDELDGELAIFNGEISVAYNILSTKLKHCQSNAETYDKASTELKTLLTSLSTGLSMVDGMNAKEFSGGGAQARDQTKAQFSLTQVAAKASTEKKVIQHHGEASAVVEARKALLQMKATVEKAKMQQKAFEQEDHDATSAPAFLQLTQQAHAHTLRGNGSAEGKMRKLSGVLGDLYKSTKSKLLPSTMSRR